MNRLLKSLLILTLTCGTVACSNSGESSTTASSSGNTSEAEVSTSGDEGAKTLIVSLGGDPVSFNPDSNTDDMAWAVASNIFDQLVTLNGNQNIEPDLATSWDISDDGLTYTFHLAEGVKWHDGEPFSSDDVIFTFDKVKENEASMASALKKVESYEAPDENTVVLHMSSPDSTLLANLAWYSTAILPKHIYDNDEDWTTLDAATSAPIGTGPFKFVSYTSGQNVTLEANPDYFQGAPQIDRLVFQIATDDDTAYQAFLNGEVDYISSVPTAYVPDIINNPDYKYGVMSSGRRYQMCFNMNGQYTSDYAVRKAISLAIDRQEISDKGTGGLQAPAYGFYPPFLDWAYNADADIGERDLTAAEKYLTDAGYTKDSDGYYLHLGLEVFTGGNYANCAQVIKSELAEIGIDVTVDVLEESAWIEKVISSGDYDLCILAGNQGPDPSNLAVRIGTGGSLNVSQYSSSEVDELLAEAAVTTGNDARGALYKQVQAIMAEDLPLVPLVEYAQYEACPANISNIPMIDVNETTEKLNYDSFAKVTID